MKTNLITKNGKSIPVYKIAEIILKDWTKVNFAAKPYLDAMFTLTSPNDNYGLDNGTNIILYFLSNASTWKGEIAKEIKTHLKKLISNKITV